MPAGEVAKTSLEYDRTVNLALYARNGIPEVWIVNLKDELLLVFRDPVAGSYTTSLILHREESVSVSLLPDMLFSVQQLLI